MKTAANAAWLTITRLGADLLGFLFFVAIARHFGPAGTGAYSYSFAVAAVVSVFGGLGLELYGMREFARLDESAHRPLLASLLATQALAVVTALAGLGIYLLATRPDVSTALAALFLSVHLLGFTVARTLFAPTFARQEMAKPAVAELVCRGLAILVGLLIVTLGAKSLIVALIGFPVAGVVLPAIAAGSARRHVGSLPLDAGWGTIASTVRVAWPFAVSDIVFQVYARADLVLLTLIAGQTVAGIYASGFKFVEVGTLPLTFLNVATFPQLSRLFDSDSRGFAAVTNGLIRRTLLLGGVIAWGFYFVMPAVIVPVFGDRFAATASLMRPLAGLALLFAAEIVLVRVLLAAHLQVARVRLFTLGTVLNVALNLILIPLFRINGALAAWILTLLVINIVYARATPDSVSRRDLLGAFIGYVAAAGTGLGAGAVTTGLGGSKWLAAGVALTAYLIATVPSGLAQFRQPEVAVANGPGTASRLP